MSFENEGKTDKRPRARFGAIFGRVVAIISAVGVVLGAALKYVELRSTCSPHPFWQCILGNPEEEARKEWDGRVSRSVTRKEIEIFMKRYPNSRVTGAVTARLAAIEEWDSISARPTAGLLKRFLERHNDPVLAEFARADLSKIERYEWKQASQDGTRAALAAYVEAWPNGANAGYARELLAKLADDDAWKSAKRAGSIDAYEAYAARFPQGEHIGAARNRIGELREDADWAAAQTAGTILALREFIRRYSGGRYAKLAEKMLIERDEQVWAQVIRSPDLPSLRLYLADWSMGRHAAEAAARIAELDDKAWEKAMAEKTLAAMQAYLAEFPAGRHRATATALASDMRDDETWALAMAAGSVEAVRQYLETFPNGRHAFTARSRLAALTDDMLWARAKSIGTQQALVRFRREQTTGRHLAELEQLLGALDDTAWQAAVAQRTVEALQAYLSDWGDGRHAGEARSRLAELRQPDECDRLAGNPDDPNVKGTGVPYSALDPHAAIVACSKAVVMMPSEARLKYQLARAQQKAGQWSQAHKLHAELASAGYVAAMDNIGWLYANGQGVPKNLTVAERYFRQAAARNHAESMFSLFLIFEKRNPEEAARWLQRAADRGYQPAVARLQASGSPQATAEDFGKGLKQIGPAIKDFKELIDTFRPPRR